MALLQNYSTGRLMLSTKLDEADMVILLTTLQVIVGAYLAIHLLAKNNPAKLKHRCVAFTFAVLGSLTVSSAVVYLPEFSLMRFFIMTSLSSVSILILKANPLDVARVCLLLGYGLVHLYLPTNFPPFGRINSISDSFFNSQSPL